MKLSLLFLTEPRDGKTLLMDRISTLAMTNGCKLFSMTNIMRMIKLGGINARIIFKTTVVKLTQEEQKAIRSLERTATIWPSSLWLFSASGDLYILKTDDCGNRVMTDSGSVDQDYIVGHIFNIGNDGGDW